MEPNIFVSHLFFLKKTGLSEKSLSKLSPTDRKSKKYIRKIKMAYIGIKSVLFKSKQHHLCFSSIAVLALVLALSETSQAQRRLDPALLEEYCKNFTHGDPELYQFYSPMYPREYPSNITCFRTITAEFGFFVRIDFRDVFRIEPPNNEGACEYDYLEVRDGDQGYAPLIGKQHIHTGAKSHYIHFCLIATKVKISIGLSKKFVK